MEENLILNKENIKAISSESRVNILKILSEKQQTLSDLSQLLNLSAPTLKEHLEVLEKVQMIKKLEEGRKWKYYQITDKGLALLQPERKRIFIVLSTFILSFAGAIAALYLRNKELLRNQFILQSEETAMDSGKGAIALSAAMPANSIQPITNSLFNYLLVIFIITGIISLILLIYYSNKNKTKNKNITLNKNKKRKH